MNNFKTIASIQTNRNVTANDLDISDKQFYVIKKFNCGFYTNDQLINILKLLTNVEYLFKYGEISISEEKLTEIYQSKLPSNSKTSARTVNDFKEINKRKVKAARESGNIPKNGTELSGKIKINSKEKKKLIEWNGCFS